MPQEGVDVVITGRDTSGPAFASMRANAHEATGAMALLGEETGVKMPRHLRSLLAGIGPLGGALSLALYPAAAVALFEVFQKMAEKIPEITDAAMGMDEEAKKSFEEQKKGYADLYKQIDDLGKKKREVALIGLSPAEQEKMRQAWALGDKGALAEDIGKRKKDLQDLNAAIVLMRTGTATPGMNAADYQRTYEKFGINDANGMFLADPIGKAEREAVKLRTEIASMEVEAAKFGVAADAAGKKAGIAFTEKADAAAKLFKTTLEQIDEFLQAHNGDFIDKVSAPFDKMTEKAREMKTTTPAQVAEVADRIQQILQERAKAIQDAWEKLIFPDGNILKEHGAGNLESALALTPQALAKPIVDPAQFEAIQRLDQQMAMVKLGTESLATSWSNLATGIETGTRSASQAVQGLAASMLGSINRIITKMIEMWAWQKITGFIMGAAIGSIGSTVPLSSLGGFQNSIQFSTASLAPPVGHAAGGFMSAGELGIVGEQGPELWVPGTSGTVVPLKRSDMNGGGSQRPIYIDARGATPGERERLDIMFRQTRTQGAVDAIVGLGEMRRRA